MAQRSHQPDDTARPTGAPGHSLIAARLPGADFWDAWCVQRRAGESPPSMLALYLGVARRTPAWIDTLMVARNLAVRPFGLKDLGRLSELPPDRPAADYRPGDRVGIFTLIEQAPDEVLLGDRDHHLDVVVSLHRQRAAAGATEALTVTTVVHVKNRLGRLYLLPVRPMHRLIARAMTTALGRA